jgi:hypothetical protein
MHMELSSNSRSHALLQLQQESHAAEVQHDAAHSPQHPATSSDNFGAALAVLQVVRCDSCSGATRDDVFTSFLFASRRKAFELMVARWRAAK